MLIIFYYYLLTFVNNSIKIIILISNYIKLRMEQKKRKNLIHSYFLKKPKSNDNEQLQNEISLKVIHFFYIL